jgi:hypothetical protein
MKKIQLTGLIILAFHLTVFAQGTLKETRLKAVYVKGKWGYADRSGKLVIKAQFDAARPFAGGLAQVGMVDEELPELGAQPNIKWGYIDERGRILVELRYAFLRNFSDDLAAVAVLDEKRSENLAPGRGKLPNLRWGYIDRSGREIIPLRFYDAGDFAEGLAPVNAGGGGEGESSLCGPSANYGYIDKTGSLVIKPQFTRASGFQNGRARVFLGQITYVGRCLCCGPKFVGKRGFVDRRGTFITDQPKGVDALIEEDLENR